MITLKPDIWVCNKIQGVLLFLFLMLSASTEMFVQVHLQTFFHCSTFWKSNSIKPNGILFRGSWCVLFVPQEWCCAVRWWWQVSGSTGRHRWRKAETENVNDFTLYLKLIIWQFFTTFKSREYEHLPFLISNQNSVQEILGQICEESKAFRWGIWREGSQ